MPRRLLIGTVEPSESFLGTLVKQVVEVVGAEEVKRIIDDAEHDKWSAVGFTFCPTCGIRILGKPDL